MGRRCLGIETELIERRDGDRRAALAHLTLVLIDLARLAVDVVGDLRHSGEPVLAEVFAVIDRRHSAALSLRDVAWIIEPRMAESRRLLADTDVPVAEVARRVGIADPGYFSRLFRRTHGTSPRVWRDRPC